MLETANQFCSHLSNGMRIYLQNGNLSWHPCCYWSGPTLPFVPELLLQQRQKLNNPKPWVHPECNKCRTEEKYNNRSQRITSLNVIPQATPASQLTWLDIQGDITCNGGCLSCGPAWSSFWQAEQARFKGIPVQSQNLDTKKVADYIFSNLDVSNLRILQFLGGEPFLSSFDQHSIEWIPNPDLCILKYTTNASIWPGKQRLELWKKFKSVNINFSIDGTGDLFEYLRYPLKWNTVDSNVRRLVESADSNYTFSINHTMSPANLLRFDEFDAWVNDVFPQRPRIHIHTAFGIAGVQNAPIELRQKVFEKYGPNHVVNQMLKAYPYQFDAKFVEYIKEWDSYRGNSILNVCPELSRLFQ